MNPSVTLYYSDIGTDPAAAGRTEDRTLISSYNDATQFFTAKPVKSSCIDSFGSPSAWAAGCRIVINYPTHIQTLWDHPRQTKDAAGKVLTDHTCTQGGCHTT